MAVENQGIGCVQGAGMGHPPRALWIDFCCASPEHGLFLRAQRSCDVLRITLPDAILAAVHKHRPQFLCVEFDYPDQTHLRALLRLRRAFPALPLLMLTEFHSEALAVWAFRSRVWDYRVKPVDEQTLARLLEAMAIASGTVTDKGWLADPLPCALITPAGHLRRPLVAAPYTGAAVAYISEHYAEPLRLQTVAGLCHLSESEFSRAFHREQGLPFRRFMLQYRLAKARDFLIEPQASVSQVAYAVGFNDLSYFGRMFRRFVGMPPKHYQHQSPQLEPRLQKVPMTVPDAESFQSSAA